MFIFTNSAGLNNNQSINVDIVYNKTLKCLSKLICLLITLKINQLYICTVRTEELQIKKKSFKSIY